MDVTRDNFEELYPEIEKAIIDCDFCSIDGEFTGITTYKEINAMDTPKIRYEKVRKNDQNFLIIQFGLCLFKQQPDSPNKYDCTAFNFYLFPQSNEKSRYGQSTAFSCLNSSLEFLISQNFDFNKVFLKGLTYLSKDKEERVRDDLERRIEANTQKAKTIQMPKNAKNDVNEEIQTNMADIEKFLQDDQAVLKEFKFSNSLTKIFTEKNIRIKYRNRLEYSYKTLENKDRIMQLTKVTNPDDEAEFKELNRQVGFSRVIWLLSQHSKLIVGHNMLIDIMQVLKQFFGPLPDSYDDFKQMVQTLFPRLIDTKYISTVQPLKDLIVNSALGDLDKILSREPFNTSVSIENCKYSVLDEKLHEAGYDAFLTGFCYIRMLHYLKSLNSTTKEAVEEYYLNKIHFMRGYDVSYMDFKNPQENPTRDHVFYLEFPHAWEMQDIYDLFSPFGNIYISWINKTSAFVALVNQDNVKKVTAQLVGVVGREYRVYFYKTYLTQISKLATNTEPSEPIKRVRSAILNGGNSPKVDTDTDDSASNKTECKKVKIQNGDVTKEKKLFDECVDW